MAAIEIAGVIKAYGATQVIHGVDLSVADGEFVVLVGPSGCGKSTLLRMIAGLESVTGGTVSIGGKIVNDLAPRDRNIAMVFQDYALYPHKSVGENIGFGLKMRGADQVTIDKKVQEAADPANRPFAGSQAGATLRRPAPARCHGPRHRPGSSGLFVRRTSLQS